MNALSYQPTSSILSDVDCGVVATFAYAIHVGLFDWELDWEALQVRAVECDRSFESSFLCGCGLRAFVAMPSVEQPALCSVVIRHCSDFDTVIRMCVTP